MKKIIFLLALVSMNAFALTPQEEQAYKKSIADKTKIQKIALAYANIGTMSVMCSGGAALTALAGAADTLPVGTWVADVLSGTRTGVFIENECNGFFGGLVSGVYDLVKEVGSIGKASNEQSFRNLKITYRSTEATAKAAFGKSGYCVDQYDRLGIILGLK